MSPHATLTVPFLLLLVAAQDGGAQRPAPGDEPGLLGEVVVEGRGTDLVGIAQSATEGTVGREELERRPILRPGELLETVPGVVITQHSGAGKANQFFLRGFNLDHGTDLATTIAGVPNNLPSHGHGQGYDDLTPLIPELVERVTFRKGPYYAEAGDFSSAGSVDIDYATGLDHGFALIEGGSYGHRRSVLGDSIDVGNGVLLYGGELFHDDGPWTVEQDFDKTSGVLRYTTGDERGGSSWTLLGYDGEWTATDHVARRAVEQDLIGRFGSLDPTSGGDSSRYTLSASWWGKSAEDSWRVTAYSFLYDLDLYSNFTYALDDPVNGDQILQRDERWVQGVTGEYAWSGTLGAAFTENRAGLQLRNDVIDNGLFRTAQRQLLSTVREDDVVQTSLGLYADSDVYWSDWLRTSLGLRGDLYRFDVDSDLEANSGTETDSILSPKAGVVLGPWSDTEVYLQGGLGFHSNDARGTTLQDDPTTPAVGDGTAVDPLVRQKGVELGVRTTAVEGLQSTLSFWYLESDSELLFVGDAGNTEPSGATERHGVEWANFWEIEEAWVVDLDLSASTARFQGGGADDHVPGAIDEVVALGLTHRHPEGHFLAIRGRYFGPRDLTEAGDVQSSSSFLVNAHVGWRFSENTLLRLSVFNLFDREVNDIEYYYPSLLPGEPPGPDDGGYNDIHFHPAEPFSVRVGLVWTL